MVAYLGDGKVQATVLWCPRCGALCLSSDRDRWLEPDASLLPCPPRKKKAGAPTV